MAKDAVKKEESAVAHIGTDKSINELNLIEMGKALAKLEYGEADEVTSEYLKLDQGEEARAYFLEMTTINTIGKPGEKSPAVRFLTEDGTLAIIANAVVVSSCAALPRLQPVLIQCTGSAGPKGAEYKTFKIFKLK